MTPLELMLDDVTIEDAESFRHIELYRELDRRLRQARVIFHVAPSGLDLPDDTRLLNLAFWDPTRHAEVLPAPELGADMVVHNGLHHVCREALGSEATSADGLLFAEAVASASDLYLVGRLLDRPTRCAFLDTQVPAMAEAAQAAGLSEDGFTRILEEAASDPDRSFESLRQLLFDASSELAAATSLDAAAAALARHRRHPLGPLLHHYAIAEWVMFVRAYATAREPRPAVRALDAELRAAPASLEWIVARWLVQSAAPAADRLPRS